VQSDCTLSGIFLQLQPTWVYTMSGQLLDDIVSL